MEQGTLNYLEKMAHEIRAEIPREKLPKSNTDPLFLIYAVLMLAKGKDVSREDVHNAWAAWATSIGKPSGSLVRFDDLSPDVQDQDQPFVDAIVAVAARYGDAS